MRTNTQIAMLWLEAFNNQDIDSLLSLYHEDAEHYSPKLLVRRPETKGYIKGKPALKNWWNDAFSRLPGLRYEVLKLTSENDQIFMEYIRHAPGEDDLRVGEVLQIHEGKITASRVYHS